MYNRQIYKLITLEKYDIQRHFKYLSMFANKSRIDIITCTCRRHSLITIFKDKTFHIRDSLHQPKELGEQIKQNWIPFYSWRNYQRVRSRLQSLWAYTSQDNGNRFAAHVIPCSKLILTGGKLITLALYNWFWHVLSITARIWADKLNNAR